MQPLIVFDMDGTLNRTELYSIQAFRLTLEAFGLHPSDQEIICQFGAMPDDILAHFLGNPSQGDRERYYRLMHEHEYRLLREHARAYDGSRQVMERLHQMGCQTAVCSNASQQYITAVMEAIGLLDQIDHIRPKLTGKTKKDTLRLLLEEVKPEKACMVGDRIFDLEAARANGIPFVGCLYGFNPEEIREADYLMDSVSQLPEIVAELLFPERKISHEGI